MEIPCTQILRTLFIVGLFVVFIFFSAEPSIQNFMREKVVTDETADYKRELQSPAMTICLDVVGIMIKNNPY